MQYTIIGKYIFFLCPSTYFSYEIISVIFQKKLINTVKYCFFNRQTYRDEN